MSVYRHQILKLWSVRVATGIRIIDFWSFLFCMAFLFLWIRVFLLFPFRTHVARRCTLVVVCFAFTNLPSPYQTLRLCPVVFIPHPCEWHTRLPSPMSSNHSHTSSSCISFLFTRLAAAIGEHKENGRRQTNFFSRVIARYIFFQLLAGV